MTTHRVTVPVDYQTLSELHTLKGWLHGLANHMDLCDVVADGGVTAGMAYQQEATEFAGRLRRILDRPLSAAPAPEGGAVLTGISLDGQQGEPAGMMTVKAHFSDGSESVLIRDNGNVISHWKNVCALATREEVPADHVSDARQMVEAPAEAGEPSLVDWFHQFIDNYVEETNGPDAEALIACLDRVRDSYRREALRSQPQARSGEGQ